MPTARRVRASKRDSVCNAAEYEARYLYEVVYEEACRRIAAGLVNEISINELRGAGWIKQNLLKWETNGTSAILSDHCEEHDDDRSNVRNFWQISGYPISGLNVVPKVV